MIQAWKFIKNCWNFSKNEPVILHYWSWTNWKMWFRPWNQWKIYLIAKNLKEWGRTRAPRVLCSRRWSRNPKLDGPETKTRPPLDFWLKLNGLLTTTLPTETAQFCWRSYPFPSSSFKTVQFRVWTLDLIPPGEPWKENESYWKALKIYSREWLVYKRGLEYVRNIFSKFEKSWISHKERFLTFHWSTNQSLRSKVIRNS